MSKRIPKEYEVSGIVGKRIKNEQVMPKIVLKEHSFKSDMIYKSASQIRWNISYNGQDM